MQKKREEAEMSRGVRGQNAVFLYFRLCLRLKANAWNSASPSRERRKQTKTHRETRAEEKKSDQRTFLFIGLCMQQASKARAEQKSLVEGLGRLVLPSLRSTAEAAHLPDRGGFVFCKESLLKCQVASAANSLTALTFAATSRNREDNSSWPYFPNNDSKISPQ